MPDGRWPEKDTPIERVLASLPDDQLASWRIQMVFGVVRYRNLVETDKAQQPTGPSQEELFRQKPKTSSLNR